MTTRREMLKGAGVVAGFTAFGGHPGLTDIPLLQNSAVVELRQYTLHVGARETLVSLFTSEFIQPQEALGMAVFGPFYDLEDPNRFVWMRGFPDMLERKRMLAAFYGGPVWMAHRQTANATMLDSVNALLLRLEHSPLEASSNSALQPHRLLVANIYYV